MHPHHFARQGNVIDRRRGGGVSGVHECIKLSGEKVRLRKLPPPRLPPRVVPLRDGSLVGITYLGSATQVMLSMPFHDTVGQNSIDIPEVNRTHGHPRVMSSVRINPVQEKWPYP